MKQIKRPQVRKSEGGAVFNGPQRAVDAMADGRDANKDRKKKGYEYGMSDSRDQTGKLKRSAGEKVSGAINKVLSGNARSKSRS